MKRFNPDIHARRSIRLQYYDYTNAGHYFVTICSWRKENIFCEIKNNETILNDNGKIIDKCLRNISDKYPNVSMDIFVIMPNHMHMVVEIVGARSPRPDDDGRGNRAPTLGQIIAYIKYQSTKQINILRDNPGVPVWQRNYYEHVIRNDKELGEVRVYIANNPANWKNDEENEIE